jgi:hypothetical protein
MPDSQDSPTNERAGHHCQHGCHGSRALSVFTLVLLSGIIGYLIGSHGSHGRRGWHHHGYGCPMVMMGTPSQTPSK